MPSPSALGPTEAPRILVVDDDESLRGMLELMLKWAMPDSVVETAEDGLAAQARIPALEPHLIITDLQMPKLDGSGLCRWVKSNGFAHTKVLVFTGNPHCGLLAQALEAGADAWLAKPPKVAELLFHVEELLAGAVPS